MIGKSMFAFILVFSLAISFADAQVVGTWRGYARMSGSIAADGTYVTAHMDNASSAVATTIIGGAEYSSEAPAGYYSLDVQCTGSQVSFKVCGINAGLYESCTSGPHYNGTEPNFNLTVTKISDGASCSYSCGCSGNYCCSGATEYTDGSGTGTCQSSVCTVAATTTTPGGGGGGGGGGGAVTTTTTTLTTTPITTTPVGVTTVGVTTKPKPVTTISPSVTTKPKFPRIQLGIELSTMQIIGIIVGIVVILALIVFLFVRFQTVKMAT